MTEKLFWERQDQERYDKIKSLTTKEIIEQMDQYYDNGYAEASCLMNELRKRFSLSHEITNAMEYDELKDSGCPVEKIIEVKV